MFCALSIFPRPEDESSYFTDSEETKQYCCTIRDVVASFLVDQRWLYFVNFAVNLLDFLDRVQK